MQGAGLAGAGLPTRGPALARPACRCSSARCTACSWTRRRTSTCSAWRCGGRRAHTGAQEGARHRAGACPRQRRRSLRGQELERLACSGRMAVCGATALAWCSMRCAAAGVCQPGAASTSLLPVTRRDLFAPILGFVETSLSAMLQAGAGLPALAACGSSRVESESTSCRPAERVLARAAFWKPVVLLFAGGVGLPRSGGALPAPEPACDAAKPCRSCTTRWPSCS